jgi:16S rRNA (uracil1498-N3)-methyltransferase
MASLYLSDELSTSSVGASVVLLGDEARHAAAVARTRVGERIAVGNGRGLIVHGTVTAVSPTEVVILVDSVENEPPAEPHL